MKFNKKENYEIFVGPYPFEVYYSPSEKAWNKLMKQWELKGRADTQYVSTTGGGLCTIFSRPNENTRCVITFNPKRSEEQIVGIIAHEATHAVDFLIEAIGEELPGKEFRAYTTQWITQNIYAIWKGIN